MGDIPVSDDRLRRAQADACRSWVVDGESLEAVYVYTLCSQLLADRTQDIRGSTASAH